MTAASITTTLTSNVFIRAVTIPSVAILLTTLSVRPLAPPKKYSPTTMNDRLLIRVGLAKWTTGIGLSSDAKFVLFINSMVDSYIEFAGIEANSTRGNYWRARM